MSGAAATAELLLPAWRTLGADSASTWLLTTPGLLVGAALLIAVGLFLMFQYERKRWWVGIALGLSGLLVLVSRIETLSGIGQSTVFWSLAALTVGSAVATITSRNPVYCAIWFAVSLLGTGALFLLQGAQFLGVATVVVYAGAIVVTFLFVLMLAQPGGHAYYDRIHWGAGPTFLAILTGSAMFGAITLAVSALPGGQGTVSGLDVDAALASKANAEPRELVISGRDTRVTELDSLPDGLPNESESAGPSDNSPEDHQHVAELGGQLFARHLVAVEVAGTLLLAALIGAVAIVIQGKAPAGGEGGPGHE